MHRGVFRICMVALALCAWERAALVFAADEAPDPACPLCAGLGIVPNSPFKSYVRFDSQPPEANVPPAWKHCEKCQKGKDVKAISAEMKECQEHARLKHKDLLEKTGLTLELAMTPYFAVHSNMPQAETKKVCDTLEKCAGLLQGTAKSMLITTARADFNDVVLFNDRNSYETYIDKIHPANPELKKRVVFGVPNAVVMLADGQPLDKKTAYHAGHQFAVSAGGSAAYMSWLEEGMGAYCQNRICGINQTFRAANNPGDGSLNAVMIRNAKDGIGTKWEHAFEFRAGTSPGADVVTSYSIVEYLIALGDLRFEKMMRNMKKGDDSVTAIERACGRKIAELQANWAKWIMTQK